MTEKKKYPADIYPAIISEGGADRASVSKYFLEALYDVGYAHGLHARNEPLEVFYNLTDAIADGEPIDWDALDGLKAKCVHPKLGVLTHKLKRDREAPKDCAGGWYKPSVDYAWKNAISDGWLGRNGWALYIKGEIPLIKRTADQLAPGTCFRSRYAKGDYSHTYDRAQVIQIDGKTQVIYFNDHLTGVIASYNPADLQVLEVYGVGTFQTPKEDA